MPKTEEQDKEVDTPGCCSCIAFRKLKRLKNGKTIKNSETASLSDVVQVNGGTNGSESSQKLVVATPEDVEVQVGEAPNDKLVIDQDAEPDDAGKVTIVTHPPLVSNGNSGHDGDPAHPANKLVPASVYYSSAPANGKQFTKPEPLPEDGAGERKEVASASAEGINRHSDSSSILSRAKQVIAERYGTHTSPQKVLSISSSPSSPITGAEKRVAREPGEFDRTKYRSALAQLLAEKYGVTPRSRSQSDISSPGVYSSSKYRQKSKESPSATSAAGKMLKGAKERGENLSRLEDVTGRLSVSASEFGSLARQLMEREKNKKWYQW